MSRQRQRDAAERVLRRMMANVITALDSVMAPGDPRWLAFGLYWPIRGSKRSQTLQIGAVLGISDGPIQLPSKVNPVCKRTVAA
jgi:hypothetical protein